MPVNRACYCTRRDVMSAPDISLTRDMLRLVDDGIQAAAGSIDRLTNRRFWNKIETAKWDWPNFQYAAPWKLWFGERELADITVYPPVVTSGGNVIPDSAIFFGYPNYSPPYTYLELDRSKSYFFGQGSGGPQRNIAVTGNFGYWTESRDAGTLAANVTTTTATTVTVSDASLADAGDVITAGTESMLVRDTALASTGQVQQGGGCSTSQSNDVLLTVTDGTQVHAGEILTLDGEQMLAEDVAGNVITVVRAYAGSVLAAHSGATVYARRLLTVKRGFGGTTAATHNSADALTAALVPDLVHELAVAESLNFVYQKSSGYARTIGENQSIVPGGSLPDLRKRVLAGYGRQFRTGVI